MSHASVHDELRAAIATGAILPNERLIESELMERFEAGRPAVRIALVRLEQEGLVEQERGHSARVRLSAVPREMASSRSRKKDLTSLILKMTLQSQPLRFERSPHMRVFSKDAG